MEYFGDRMVGMTTTITLDKGEDSERKVVAQQLQE